MAILGGYANGYMANMGIMFVKNLEADAGATPGTTWGSHLPALPEWNRTRKPLFVAGVMILTHQCVGASILLLDTNDFVEQGGASLHVDSVALSFSDLSLDSS